ncbi:MAG TPA: TIGR02677 family protein [Opitutaceae bacterium]|jgi:uncharacterized protein (TIGR02677 family)
MSLDGAHYSVFVHLSTERRELYRAVLGVFVARRAQFVISLRPAEVAEGLRSAGLAADEAEIQAVLLQLRAWGNLDDTPDQVEAATIEEFYRNRRLYHLSEAGEAAERALAQFEEFLHRPGQLQTTALHDIIELLDSLLPLLAESPPDDAKLHHALTALSARFEELASRAQSFMRGLQGSLELQGISVSGFSAYKEKLIEYLERFIGELVVATSRIAEQVTNLEVCGVDAAFLAAARRELVDALEAEPDALAKAERAWRQRWTGLRRWFLSDDGPSQSELLRARARSAIPALLTALAQINDRRASRADRAADFLALARWFAEAPSAADCHRLWRAAFALAPARHLRINAETLSRRSEAPDHARLSWLAAEPMWLSPRLRQSGRAAARGPAPATIDRAAAKRHLREIAAEQARQILAAQQRLLGAGRVRLGAMGFLEEPAFRLLLDLIGHALSQQRERGAAVSAESADGTLRVTLDPIADAYRAELATPIGTLAGRDYWFSVEPFESKRGGAARW